MLKTHTRSPIRAAQGILLVLFFVLFSRRLVVGMTATGCALVVGGLPFITDSPFGRGRWAIAFGVGSVLMGAGMALMGILGPAAMILTMLGAALGLCALIALARAPRPPLLPAPPPQTLAEDMRLKAGLPDQSTEQDPLLQVVLVSAGDKPIKVTKALRELYRLGLAEAYSMTQHAPALIQTTTSRQEADFVAAQLSKLGAQVDIREAPNSEDADAQEA